MNAHQFANQMPEANRKVRDPVCLVAYDGGYQPGEVVDAKPPGPGRYAVVAVATGNPVLLGASVDDRLPFRFRHRA